MSVDNCPGQCVTGADLGAPEWAAGYVMADPECPAHGELAERWNTGVKLDDRLAALATAGKLEAYSVGPFCPECVAGKCRNCDGRAWDDTRDEPAECMCEHEPRGGDQ